MDLDITEAAADDDGSSGQVRLTVTGSLDLESRTQLLDAGRAALRREGCLGLVLDLSGVSFVDSTGIGAFVELASDAEDQGATFEVRSPSPRVQRLLEVTGLSDAWS